MRCTSENNNDIAQIHFTLICVVRSVFRTSCANSLILLDCVLRISIRWCVTLYALAALKMAIGRIRPLEGTRGHAVVWWLSHTNSTIACDPTRCGGLYRPVANYLAGAGWLGQGGLGQGGLGQWGPACG